MTTRHLRVAAVGLGALALVASACSDKKETTTSSGGPKTLTAVPGFDPATNTIKLGVITPLSGPIAAIGLPLTAGNDVWFKRVNAAGGIAGKYKVELVKEDSVYNPQTAVQKYNALKGSVVAFAQILGTPSVNAVAPTLKADNILAAPASLDAEWVGNPNLLPIGGPYQIQMVNAVSYFVTEGGGTGKKLCHMGQNDVYGQAGVEGVDFAAKELSLTITKKETYASTKGGEAAAQVQSLKDAGCEAVFLTSTPTDTAGILGLAAKSSYSPKWIGQSPSWIGALAASPLKDYFAANFLVASEGTEWGDTSVPGMKAMLDDVAKFAPEQKPDYYFGFGYNQARAMAAVLEKAVALGDLSHAGMIKATEQVGTLKFDGLSGDYPFGAPKDRKPPRATTLFKVDLAKPVGLGVLKRDFTSPAAEKFQFKTS